MNVSADTGNGHFEMVHAVLRVALCAGTFLLCEASCTNRNWQQEQRACGDRDQDALSQINAALQSADKSCQSDQDCVLFDLYSSCCLFACFTQTAVVSNVGATELDNAIEVINATTCDNTFWDCPCAIPPCIMNTLDDAGTPAAVCLNGQCRSVLVDS